MLANTDKVICLDTESDIYRRKGGEKYRNLIIRCSIVDICGVVLFDQTFNPLKNTEWEQNYIFHKSAYKIHKIPGKQIVTSKAPEAYSMELKNLLNGKIIVCANWSMDKIVNLKKNYF